MPSLAGKVAVVVGASRGAGRGIALALGEAGAVVYVVARTSRGGPKPADGAPGAVEDTAEAVTKRGGTGIPVTADPGDEAQSVALFDHVEREQGRLDVLANSAWSPNCMAVWSKSFADLESSLWHETLRTVSAHWFSAAHAARLMRQHGRGLIALVTDNIPGSPGAHRGQILHDLGHECLNRLVMGMARNSKKWGIAVVGINPGFMRTERVMTAMKTEAIKRQFRFDLSESTEYIGRAVVALAAVTRKNGELLWVADLAAEYGFTDLGGRYIPRFDPNAPAQEFPC